MVSLGVGNLEKSSKHELLTNGSELRCYHETTLYNLPRRPITLFLIAISIPCLSSVPLSSHSSTDLGDTKDNCFVFLVRRRLEIKTECGLVANHSDIVVV
jgi:hypothetical protein